MMTVTAPQRIRPLQVFLLCLFEQLAHIPRGLEANLIGNFAGISDSAVSR
jgi:hypothetical protein